MNWGPYSKSRIGNIQLCGFFAYLQYVKNIKIPMGEAALRGMGIHAVVADMISEELGLSTNHVERHVERHGEITEEMENEAYVTVENLPLKIGSIKHVERMVGMTDKGEYAEFFGKDVWYRMVFDLIGVEDGQVYVLDLKSGRPWDSVLERHGLVAGARLLFTKAKTITFGRFYTRDLRSEWYEYRWEKNKLIIDDDKKYKPNYLFDFLKSTAEACEKKDGSPEPGAVCHNIYGQPCPFMGKECTAVPAGDVVPVGDTEPIEIPKEPTKYLKSLPEKDQIAAAFKMVGAGMDPKHITPLMWDKAYQGTKHVRKMATIVEKILKEKARKKNFDSAGKTFGWQMKPVFDEARALGIMLARIDDVDEIAKAVNLSRSSVDKLTKPYQKVKDYIYETCQDDEKESFGEIKK